MSIRIDRYWEDCLLAAIEKQRMAVHDLKFDMEAKIISPGTYWKALDTLDFLLELWEAMKERDILFHKRHVTEIDYDLLERIRKGEDVDI